MPVYDYKCQKCGKVFEKFLRSLVSRRHGEMRKMRQRQGGKTGLLLRHFIRGKSESAGSFQIVPFLRQLLEPLLQHLPLAARRIG